MFLKLILILFVINLTYVIFLKNFRDFIFSNSNFLWFFFSFFYTTNYSTEIRSFPKVLRPSVLRVFNSRVQYHFHKIETISQKARLSPAPPHFQISGPRKSQSFVYLSSTFVHSDPSFVHDINQSFTKTNYVRNTETSAPQFRISDVDKLQLFVHR